MFPPPLPHPLKFLVPPAFCLLVLLAGPPDARAQQSGGGSSVPAVLREAQQAYAAGDLDTARQKFQLVIAEEPRNVVARNYLKMIAAADARGGGSKKLERQLQSLEIPAVDFRDATLDSALEFLRQQAEKVGNIRTTFVVQPGVDASRPVTLKLTNVPFTEVLRYIGQLANARFEIESYAINVRPLTGGAPEATPAPTSAQ